MCKYVSERTNNEYRCNGNIRKLITYLYTARLSASNCAWSIPLGDILFSCIFLRSQPPAAANISRCRRLRWEHTDGDTARYSDDQAHF